MKGFANSSAAACDNFSNKDPVAARQLAAAAAAVVADAVDVEVDPKVQGEVRKRLVLKFFLQSSCTTPVMIFLDGRPGEC